MLMEEAASTFRPYAEIRAIHQTLSNLGVDLPAGAVGAKLNPILVDRYTQQLRHGGNYKQPLVFFARRRTHLPPAWPYPKLDPLFHYSVKRGKGIER
jgi:hypothetical protein